MDDDDQHPQIHLSPAAVIRFRAWMVKHCIPGTAEELIGGLLFGGEAVVTDEVLSEVMEMVEQLIALHGYRWFHVLKARGDAVDRGVPPIEPRLN